MSTDKQYQQRSSIETYTATAETRAIHNETATVDDIECLLAICKRELFATGRSPLISMAYSKCMYFFSANDLPVKSYRPYSFYLPDTFKKENIPTFDAWWLILLLGEFIDDDTLKRDVTPLLKHFFGNYSPANPDFDDLLKALRRIDRAVGTMHQTIIAEYYAENDTVQTTGFFRRVISFRSYRTEGKAAQGDGEKKPEDVCRQAEMEAERIIRKAEQEAKAKLEAANAARIKAATDSRADAFDEEQRQFREDFSGVREALLKTNELVRALEDNMTEVSVRKAAKRLMQLFNLIADTRDSAFELARQQQNAELENAACNMDVFLEMINENMADYGIRTIISLPGDKFSPKLHQVVPDDQLFNPASATVKASRRNGFIWGEQVLQKEQVEI